MIKKITGLFLVMILFVSILSGCKTNKSNENQSSNASSTENTGSAENKSTADNSSSSDNTNSTEDMDSTDNTESPSAENDSVKNAANDLLEGYRKADSDTLNVIYTKMIEVLEKSDDPNVVYVASYIEELKDGSSSETQKVFYDKLEYTINDAVVEETNAVVELSATNVDFIAIGMEHGSSILGDMSAISKLDKLPVFTKDCKMEFVLKDGNWVFSGADLEFADIITFGAVTISTSQNAGEE